MVRLGPVLAFFIKGLASIMRYLRPAIRFRPIFMLGLLGLLFVMAPGCETTTSVQYTIPPPQPPVAPPPPSVSVKPEVVQGSLASLGGPKTIIHEVGPLETVWRISRMYGVTADSIYKANGITSKDCLREGQRLTIPNARMLRHVINLYRNNQWTYIVIHHTATWQGNAKAINRSHGDRGFWNGLGYHFLIDNGTMGKGDGQIEMSPRWIRQQTGAHCKADGMNDRAVGVALVGNFDIDLPTPNQLQSLNYLLKTLCAYYKIPSTNILGHREVEGARTECPGKNLALAPIRQAVAGKSPGKRAAK